MTTSSPPRSSVRSCRLGDIASVRYGKARPANSGDVPVIGSGGVYAYTDEPLADETAIVVGRKGTAGRVIFPQRPSWPSDTTFFIEPDTSSISPAFLALYLQHANLSSDSTKTTMPSLQAQQLTELQVNLPDLQEQRRIARILSTIQTARSAETAALERTRQLRTTLARRLLEPRAGWARSVPFREVVEIASGQVDPREEPYASLPHVAPDNIESNTGRLLPVKSARVLGLISGKYRFQPGDVLYSKIRPYLNKAAIAPFAGTCSADMYVLRGVAGRINNQFLLYLLLSDTFLVQATSHQNRTGIPKINRQQLDSILLDFPPLDEQQDIARSLMTVDAAQLRSLTVAEAIDGVFESTLVHLLESAV